MENCKSVADLALDLWKKYGSLAPSKVVAVEQVLEQMINFFNSLIKDPKLHIGPRALPLGEPQTGEILSVGDRTFVAPVPTTKPSKVVVTKNHGKDHVVVHVCGFDAKGGHTELATFDITASTPDGHSFQANIPAEIITTVIFDGQTVGLTSMSYSVLLTNA